jgi:hypothetical protein
MMNNKYEIPQGSHIKYAPACDDIYDFLGSYSHEDKK